MTLKLTNFFFRFDVSTSELHLNVFYDQTEREREEERKKERETLQVVMK